MPPSPLTYPFSAIVGQDSLKLALLLNAIDPRIGGVLIAGTKGTGKSTAVRAFADLLPDAQVVAGCPYACNPADLTNLCRDCFAQLRAEGTLPTTRRKMRVVQLPLSATEDRLLGALDVESILTRGTKRLQPGLLAEANQNVLYVDEVNLLPDHLTDSLLDAAASGWNVVEREGVSVRHPARFILVGTMNPEEGELRPQILDRFALHVVTDHIVDRRARVDIVRRNIAFEADPVGFSARYAPQQRALRSRITAARRRLPRVAVPPAIYDRVGAFHAQLRVDGHRSDIAAVKAAKALAAFKGREVVTWKEVTRIAPMSLRRRRHDHEVPFDVLTTGEPVATALLSNRTVRVPPRTNVTGLNTPTEEEVLAKLAEPSKPPKRTSPSASRLLTLLGWALIPILIVGITFFASSTLLLIFYRYAGTPLQSIVTPVYTQQVLLATALLSTLAILTLLFKKRRTPHLTYYRRTFDGVSDDPLKRRVVQQTTHSDDLSKAKMYRKRYDQVPLRSLTIPLYASLSRIYKFVLSRGPKLAQTVRQLLGGEARYEFAFDQAIDARRRNLAGRRLKTVTTTQRGRYVWYEFPKRRPWDVALAPTIRAASPYQHVRRRDGLKVRIERRDIRVKVRETRTSLTILLLLDMSESMKGSLANIRKAVQSVHDLAYKKRDRVGLIVFKGSTATVLQHPTTNLNLIVKKLLHVGASDFTPLAAGMFQAWRVLRNEKMRRRDIIPALIIISDGIVNVHLKRPLTPFTREKYLNVAQADVLDAANLLGKDGIKTIVINPAHEDASRKQMQLYYDTIAAKKKKQWLYPTTLLLEIPRLTGGFYYGIGGRGTVERVVLEDAFTAFYR
jgi:magnesium chelatase subunit I